MRYQMEIKKIKRKIVSKLDKQNNQYEINSNEMITKLKDMDALLDEAELGGGKHHHERLAKKGKMSIRERIFNVLDPDTPCLLYTSPSPRDATLSRMPSSA